jgi:tetratricopeptide (TPR) repeat protein
LQRQAYRLAARFAEYAGWMAQEAGDNSGALWWTNQAVGLAEAGDDTELGEYAFVRRALVALYNRNARATIELAERAQAPTASSRTRGLGAQREAQGHAIAGDYDACMAALDRATKHLDQAAKISDGEPLLGTASVSDPVALARGWCLVDLGRWEEAVEVLSGESQRIPFTAQRARARFAARLALAHALRGDVDQACAIVESVLDVISVADSATIRIDLTEVLRTLLRWRAEPAVQLALPRLIETLRDST